MDVGYPQEYWDYMQEKRARCRWVQFVCWFSRKFWDIHDYRIAWGGDGHANHFHTYTCWNCDKEFVI